MNKAEKQVSQKVLDCPRKIVHMSISELAKFCEVSETTIFRFCNKIGFKGFQEFKINLALNIASPMENIHSDISENDDSYLIMKKILKSSVLVLEKTMEVNQAETIEKVTRHILDAKKILFWGNGGSAILAEDAYHKFYRLGLNVQTASDIHWQQMQASLLEENDLVFIFSSSGANKDLLEVMEFAHTNKTITVLISQHELSPLAQKADICLISCGNNQEFRSEAMESRFSTLLLIDTLFIKTSIMIKSKALKNLYKVREGIAGRRI